VLVKEQEISVHWELMIERILTHIMKLSLVWEAISFAATKEILHQLDGYWQCSLKHPSGPILSHIYPNIASSSCTFKRNFSITIQSTLTSSKDLFSLILRQKCCSSFLFLPCVLWFRPTDHRSNTWWKVLINILNIM
jgi:hypothetical protein